MASAVASDTDTPAADEMEEQEDVLDSTERAAGESKKSPHHSPTLQPEREMYRQKAERFEFDVLSTETFDEDEDHFRTGVLTRLESVRTRDAHHTFWQRMSVESPADDRFFDMAEDKRMVLSAKGASKIQIPSLQECQKQLKNPEAEKYRQETVTTKSRLEDMVMNIFAALYIWFINMATLESIVVVVNAGMAAYFYSKHAAIYAAKLDFSFLAFAVVFPLTFLMQSTLARREQAPSFLADFKASILTTSLMTLTVDWPDTEGDLSSGRLALPEHFNANVVKDFQELVQLVYQYLSMPCVSHARNVVYWSKQQATKRVHALQNGIVKKINDNFFDLAMHTEEMRKHGFPSGEASRLHQYHQFLQQRFEHLRLYKYYRTPQATRSFGRAYILILPWLCGPYFAWVYVETSETFWFAIVLSGFTFLIVLGLLNAQYGMEDPFSYDFKSWLPGIDSVKLEFEMAVLLQAIEQYYANANLQRTWLLRKKEREKKQAQSTVVALDHQKHQEHV
jgi:hypothetical protein